MQIEFSNGHQENTKIWVNQLKSGDKVQSIFQVTRITLREFEKGKFLAYRLGDRTGKISAVQWERAEETYQRIAEGDLAMVEGWVGTYQQEMQIKIQSIRKIEDVTRIDPADFLPISPTSVENLTQEFDSILDAIVDPDYKRLLLLFRQDESLWSRFSLAPGAKRWHHPYLHGLLDHTLSVVKICRGIAPLYPEIDLDLLIAGAIFHDCGKMVEFVYQTYIDYSTEGRLIGHLIQGTLLVERLIDRIPDFPPEKRMVLLHIIVSHHGEVERSPVLPMTLEACLLHHIENLDAQMAAIRREMGNAQQDQKSWTGYIKLMERSLYLGETSKKSDNEATEKNFDF